MNKFTHPNFIVETKAIVSICLNSNILMHIQVLEVCFANALHFIDLFVKFLQVQNVRHKCMKVLPHSPEPNLQCQNIVTQSLVFLLRW
jgi:hypothetical protein